MGCYSLTLVYKSGVNVNGIQGRKCALSGGYLKSSSCLLTGSNCENFFSFAQRIPFIYKV